ncbi:hypothetical protein BS78_03G368600 [Paspalum vaginatum]|nr:hypothetical protein BS78_03G368600 [Paspalum vaginatum]
MSMSTPGARPPPASPRRKPTPQRKAPSPPSPFPSLSRYPNPPPSPYFSFRVFPSPRGMLAIGRRDRAIRRGSILGGASGEGFGWNRASFGQSGTMDWISVLRPATCAWDFRLRSRRTIARGLRAAGDAVVDDGSASAGEFFSWVVPVIRVLHHVQW